MKPDLQNSIWFNLLALALGIAICAWISWSINKREIKEMRESKRRHEKRMKQHDDYERMMYLRYGWRMGIRRDLDESEDQYIGRVKASLVEVKDKGGAAS